MGSLFSRKSSTKKETKKLIKEEQVKETKRKLLNMPILIQRLPVKACTSYNDIHANLRPTWTRETQLMRPPKCFLSEQKKSELKNKYKLMEPLLTKEEKEFEVETFGFSIEKQIIQKFMEIIFMKKIPFQLIKIKKKNLF